MKGTIRTMLRSGREITTIESADGFFVVGSVYNFATGESDRIPSGDFRFYETLPVHGPFPLDDPRFSPPHEDKE